MRSIFGFECRHFKAYIIEVYITPFIVLQSFEIPFAIVDVITQNDVIFFLLVEVIIDNNRNRFKPQLFCGFKPLIAAYDDFCSCSCGYSNRAVLPESV